MPPAIVVENLEKTYAGKIRAVQGVTFEVQEREIFGFLGPNGAGKTTTVSMLTTLLRPTAGRAQVDGIDVATDPRSVRRRIGLVFQESTADDQLTGEENLELAAALYDVPRSETRSRIDALLEQMNLTSVRHRLVKTYSGGMRRRLELAAGVIHTPKVLFLDEPTLGLDPQGRAGIGQYIRRMRDDFGVTVFLTTHYLDEADALCDRIAIIDRGQIRALGSPNQLKDRLGGDILTIVPRDEGPDLSPLLGKIPGILSVSRRDGSYRLKSDRGEAITPTVVETCFRNGVTLASVSLKRPSLDEVFLEFTGRQYREDEGPSATDVTLRMNQFRGRSR
jgi:ABC-2 type transport system ATP-binding protein